MKPDYYCYIGYPDAVRAAENLRNIVENNKNYFITHAVNASGRHYIIDIINGILSGKYDVVDTGKEWDDSKFNLIDACDFMNGI